MERRPMTRLAVTLFATLLALGAAACGDDDDEPTTSGDGTTASTAGDDGGDPYGSGSGGTTGGDAAEGTIVAKDFSLSDVTVAPGAEIVLDNQDGTKHTATGDEDEFDLEADGGSKSDAGTAPEEPGTYTFHCKIHSDMTATLTVEG